MAGGGGSIIGGLDRGVCLVRCMLGVCGGCIFRVYMMGRLICLRGVLI
jgi:hypothetical protein